MLHGTARNLKKNFLKFCFEYMKFSVVASIMSPITGNASQRIEAAHCGGLRSGAIATLCCTVLQCSLTLFGIAS